MQQAVKGMENRVQGHGRVQETKQLSVVIIVKNEEKNIRRCLDSVRPVADEILVVDAMSTDDTAAICSGAGCRVLYNEFTCFGSQKQFAVDSVSHDWILSIDADEVMTDQLAGEIVDWKYGARDVFAAYRIPFSLSFMGRILKHGHVGTESHVRLFNRKFGSFTQVPVHEEIVVNGPTGMFNGKIIHYSYRDTAHHLEKINVYSSYAAEMLHRKGKKFPKGHVFFKFQFKFLFLYLLRGGFLDGYPGFMWAFQAAYYAAIKAAKTIELNRKP